MAPPGLERGFDLKMGSKAEDWFAKHAWILLQAGV